MNYDFFSNKEKIFLAIASAILLIAFGAMILSSCAPAEDASRAPHREYFTHEAPDGSEYIEWETPRGMVCVYMHYDDALDCEFPR